MMPITRLLGGAGVICSLAGWLLAGCSSDEPEDTGPPTPVIEPYIVFARDFRGFRSWQKFDLGENAPTVGKVHDAGHRIEYLKARPPAGSTTFPLGTIIVKESIIATKTQIFALVKRAGGYNENGATDWEWFELKDRTGGGVEIEWRGLSAPAGEGYGGPQGDCNTCHAAWKDNDFVASEALKLAGVAATP